MTGAPPAAATCTAVVTPVNGRHEHLRGQRWGLDRQSRRPDLHVVVAMADPDIAGVADDGLLPTTVPATSTIGGELPLAAARNLGAATALDAGAEVLIFLDVDCIPSPGLVHRYAEVLAAPAGAALPVIACGEVAYLPPVRHPRDYRRREELSTLAEPHPGRPRPASAEVLTGGDVRLFWSLSFAVTAAHWRSLGGFDEAYVGYGGEDTDFGQRLRSAGGDLRWVGGATAYHQHHPVETPPVRHLVSIVRNANVFHDRWGWFPMTTWLEAFAKEGLIVLDPRTHQWGVRAGSVPAGAG